ncbi:MAG: hypothetical protein RIS92_139 [Verrucomicrobiota bacterium]|jgi:hypothetical protein
MRHSAAVISAFSVSLAAHAGIDFKQQVKPVLEAHCVRCHSAEKTKGGLRLDTKEGLLKGGDSGSVTAKKDPDALPELARRVTLPRGHEEIMPQETEPLSGPHRKWLVEWVNAGAEWPEGVVLKQLKKEVPGLAEKSLIPDKAPASLKEAAATIDSILAKENAALKEGKPQTANPIDDLAFLRRASVDLIARIPTAEEIRQFEQDRSPDRRSKLVDRLIASKAFADRWTVFFADMLRIRTNKRLAGGPELLAFVNKSVAENKPYDRLVRELITTNGRPDNSPAVGFTLGDDANPMPLAGATSQIFLGVRLQCAECHDHPFDDWKQKEFYELAAFFGQTKQVEKGKNVKTIYATEIDENMVKWPPEREQPPKRDSVAAKFPIQLLKFDKKPHYIARLEDLRNGRSNAAATKAASKELDALVDDLDTRKVLKTKTQDAALLAEAAAAARARNPDKTIYSESGKRAQLADFITDPANPFFARAFVNRIWAELVGRGFVEPLDNFSAYNEMRHPQTLQYIAQEFIASGYDLRNLVKLVMLTDTYQRGHLPEGVSPNALALAESNFTSTRPRRMLGEVLLDSITTAGHLFAHKWPEGANVREIEKQIRIPLAPREMIAAATDGASADDKATMMAMQPSNPAAYDSEKGAALDFDALLKPAMNKKGGKDESAGDVLSESKMDAMKKQKMEDDAAEAAREARRRLLASGNAERFRLETVKQVIDDNPKFDSSMRMATPAPPSHFLRVFGQPARDNLGEFRDELPSLRQELMMLNGKATHEAARVGPLEPVFKLIDGPSAQPDKAVELVYLECLTRRPSKDELAEAREVIASGNTPVDGLADLRWALLNSQEFRFVP